MKNLVILYAILWITTSVISTPAIALGNHPEADTCPETQPYYSVCTHSLHNLEGWYGQCQKTHETAQQDADQHVKLRHNGNSRWTGVLKARGR